MRRVLQLPAYRRLLAAYTLNELAYSVGSLALALLVLRRTGSDIATAGYFLCSQFVPALLAPALVARLQGEPSRRVLPLIYAAEAAAFGLLALLASQFSLAGVLAVTLLDGVLALTARALARAASVSATAPAGLLREGNALANATFSVCFMAGPAIGGAIVAGGGASAGLLVDAGLLALIALTLATAADLPLPSVARGPGGGRLQAALRHVRALPPVRTLLGLQAVGLLFFSISIPVEVVLAIHTLHAGAVGFGLLTGAWGAGAVAGSGVYARFRAGSSRALICGGAAALGIGLAAMAAAPGLAVAMIGGAIAGCGNGVEVVAARTALQEQAEADWMALIVSLGESVQQAVPGGGILLGGALTALGGPRLALAIGGIGSVLVALGGWPLLSLGLPDEALA